MSIERVRIVALTTPGYIPAAGARVTVFLADGITLVAGGPASVDGEFDTRVGKPGAYQIVVDGHRCLFPVTPTDIPDTGGEDLTLVTIIGASVLSNDADPARRCVVYGYVVGPDGDPGVDVRVTADVASSSTNRGVIAAGGTGIDKSQVSVAGGHVETRTDGTGYWELPLLVGANVRVAVGSTAAKTFRVPCMDEVSIRDVRDWLGPSSM